MTTQQGARRLARSLFVATCVVTLVGCGGGGGGSPATPTPAPAPTPAPPAAGPAPVPAPAPAPAPPPAGPVITGVPQLARSVVLSSLNNPWDLAFTPDGALLFTEKCNGLSVRRADGSVRRLFGAAGSAVVASDFFCRGQSGMLGVAVDPQFATNRMVYIFMQSNLSSPATNRIVRLQVDNDYMSVSNRTDIVTDLVYKVNGNAHGGAGAHSGGRIRFGPDGFLWITTGDNHNGPLPQDLNRLGGKVVRVDRNGTAAPGNGVSAGDARIYSYGHRNVQGISFRPGTNRPYVCEHGPNHSDEVTPLTAGGNAGWDPKDRPALNCADGYCGYAGSPGTMPMTDTQRFAQAMRPVWSNQSRSQGVGPCTFLSGPQWGDWNGRLLVGVMGDDRLVILQVDQNDANATESSVDVPAARYRSLVQGPDGNLYVSTDGGEILRMTPQQR